MFSPKIGRFITEDPIGLDAGDANLYRYVGNDPINRQDPSGLKSGWDTPELVFGTGSNGGAAGMVYLKCRTYYEDWLGRRYGTPNLTPVGTIDAFDHVTRDADWYDDKNVRHRVPNCKVHRLTILDWIKWGQLKCDSPYGTLDRLFGENCSANPQPPWSPPPEPTPAPSTPPKPAPKPAPRAPQPAGPVGPTREPAQPGEGNWNCPITTAGSCDLRIFPKAERDEFLKEMGDFLTGWADLLADLAPGLGDLKSLFEAITGINFLTGEGLSRFERGIALAGSLPFIPGSPKVLRPLLEFLEAQLKRLKNSPGCLPPDAYNRAIEVLESSIAKVRKWLEEAEDAGKLRTELMKQFFKGQTIAKTPENIATLRWYRQVAEDVLAKYAADRYTGPGVQTQLDRLAQIAEQLRKWGVE